MVISDAATGDSQGRSRTSQNNRASSVPTDRWTRVRPTMPRPGVRDAAVDVARLGALQERRRMPAATIRTRQQNDQVDPSDLLAHPGPYMYDPTAIWSPRGGRLMKYRPPLAGDHIYASAQEASTTTTRWSPRRRAAVPQVRMGSWLSPQLLGSMSQIGFARQESL